jgi:hypothetical protein
MIFLLARGRPNPRGFPLRGRPNPRGFPLRGRPNPRGSLPAELERRWIAA